MRNKIIYIGGFRLPNYNASAVRAIEISWLLNALEYDVKLLGKLENLDGTIINQKEYNGFECFDIRQPFKQKKECDYTNDISSVQNVVEHFGNTKVVAIIAYNYPAKALNKLIKFYKKFGISVIPDCTEWYGWEGKNIIRNIRRLIDTEYRMRVVAKRAKNIICAGSYLENYYNGLNTVSLPFCMNTKLPRWQITSPLKINSPRVFVYAGSPGMGMSKDKINLVIEALYEISLTGKKFKYIVIGITKEQYLKSFKSHKHILQSMSESIIFKGRIPHEDVIHTLQCADYSLFIRPNNRVSHAGFPTKIMEAFSCGIPTVTNATSDISLYVNDKINGFIIKDTSKRGIEASLLETLEISDDILYNLKKECRENNPFAIENFIHRTKAFFKRIEKES